MQMLSELTEEESRVKCVRDIHFQMSRELVTFRRTSVKTEQLIPCFFSFCFQLNSFSYSSQQLLLGYSLVPQFLCSSIYLSITGKSKWVFQKSRLQSGFTLLITHAMQRLLLFTSGQGSVSGLGCLFLCGHVSIWMTLKPSVHHLPHATPISRAGVGHYQKGNTPIVLLLYTYCTPLLVNYG